MNDCRNCKNTHDVSKFPCKTCYRYGADNDPTMWEEKKPTNADKIRAMTDEELAKWIAWDTSCETCEVRKSTLGECECHRSDCGTAWLDWLKQEATENK